MQSILFTLVCLITAAASAPVSYDQRQDGELNISADVQNVVFVIAYPQKMSMPLDILDDFLKSNKQPSHDTEVQERADHVMEAFVEPNTPYQVEIGSGDRSAEGDGRAVEVVIAGRRRMGPEPQNESELDDEIKLIGDQIEQCGPERVRDPVTLMCRWRTVPNAAPAASQPELEKEKVIPKPSLPEIEPQVVSS